MQRIRWLQFLGSLGLEFWLPLPLLGLGFWLVSGWMVEQNLSHPAQTTREIQIVQNDRPSSEQVLSIQVTIDRNKGISVVKVKQATRVFEKQEFQLSTTELEQVEVLIGKQLSLSVEQVRQLVRYQMQP